MQVDSNKIKTLRSMTQAGFLDCKNALAATNNDLDKAVLWLREKGIAKALKKAADVATEGVAQIVVQNDVAALVEVNCQTDFVTKNSAFIQFVQDILAALVAKQNTADLENTKLANGKTIAEQATELTAVIKEKISLRRAVVLVKKPEQTFAAYVHHNQKMAGLLILDKQASAETAQNIAMHLVAMKPLYIDEQHVDQNWLATEKSLLAKKSEQDLLAKNQTSAKPIQITPELLAKTTAGRINKLLKDVCLLAQPYVKDNSLTVAAYLKQHNLTVLAMHRYEVGEGIEVAKTDFASEVYKQMQQF